MGKKDSAETPGMSRAPDRPGSVIGTETVVKGEVSGAEDLFVSGRVEGRLSLAGHHITVKRKGRLRAEVVAKSIRIGGFVEGIIEGEDKIHLTETGRVQGRVTAPKVVLDEGCRFKGGINMGDKIRPPSE